MEDPRIVIAGGGFAGLAAARALRGAAVRVTLIDTRNYFLFQPLLYQVASGDLHSEAIATPPPPDPPGKEAEISPGDPHRFRFQT